MNGTTVIDPYSFHPTTIILAECIFGVVVNSLLLIVIYRNPLQNLRKRGCTTIANLAVADLISNAGSIAFCFYDPAARQDPRNFWFVKCYYAIVHLGFSASFFMLFLLSIEVYIITKYPLTAHLKLTRRKSFWILVFLWFGALVIASSNFWTADYPFVAVIVTLSVLEISVMVVMIFRILVILNMRRNQQRIAELMPQRPAADTGLTVSFLLLFVVYLVTAFPYFVAEQVHALWHTKPSWNISFHHDIIVYYLPIAHINFVINPIIYAYRMPDYRRALIALFTCKKPTKSSLPQTPVSDRQTIQSFTINGNLCEQKDDINDSLKV